MEKLIPFFGTAREHSTLKKQLLNVCDRTLLHGISLQGPEVKEFEKEIGAFTNRQYAIAVGSCTDALYFGLKSLNITTGDEVIVSAYSFVASASCILRVGAKPVFIDVNENGNMQIENVRQAINANTKAIIYVHMFGLLENAKELQELAKSNGLSLIEDAAQAFGAGENSCMAGSIGDLSCFSFDPTKVLSAPGSGGMLLTDSTDIAVCTRELRYHGKTEEGINEQLGYNSQMPSITAGILLEKFKYEEKSRKRRIEIATHYIRELSDTKLGLPPMCSQNNHVFHKFVIRSDSRDDLKNYLTKLGIPSLIHYAKTLPEIPLFAEYKEPVNNLLNAKKLSQKALSLPIHAYLSDEEVSRIITSVHRGIKLLKNKN
mgnify:CR=1 FL=1|jgi:dTDP-4-amino-4,6-dideoxygalactose transaminase